MPQVQEKFIKPTDSLPVKSDSSARFSVQRDGGSTKWTVSHEPVNLDVAHWLDLGVLYCVDFVAIHIQAGGECELKGTYVTDSCITSLPDVSGAGTLSLRGDVALQIRSDFFNNGTIIIADGVTAYLYIHDNTTEVVINGPYSGTIKDHEDAMHDTLEELHRDFMNISGDHDDLSNE